MLICQPDQLNMDRIVTHCLHEFDQSLVVFMPAGQQVLFRREFITTQLHRHLKTVGVKIVEVLHTWSETKQNCEKLCWLSNASSSLNNWPVSDHLIFSRQSQSLRNGITFLLTSCKARPLCTIYDSFLTMGMRRSTLCAFIGHCFVGICICSCKKLENLQNKASALFLSPLSCLSTDAKILNRGKMLQPQFLICDTTLLAA